MEKFRLLAGPDTVPAYHDYLYEKYGRGFLPEEFDTLIKDWMDSNALSPLSLEVDDVVYMDREYFRKIGLEVVPEEGTMVGQFRKILHGILPDDIVESMYKATERPNTNIFGNFCKRYFNDLEEGKGFTSLSLRVLDEAPEEDRKIMELVFRFGGNHLVIPKVADVDYLELIISNDLRMSLIEHTNENTQLPRLKMDPLGDLYVSQNRVRISESLLYFYDTYREAPMDSIVTLDNKDIDPSDGKQFPLILRLITGQPLYG